MPLRDPYDESQKQNLKQVKAWYELSPGESPDYGPGPEGETSAERRLRTGIYTPDSQGNSPVEKYLPTKRGGAPPKEITILTNITEPKPNGNEEEKEESEKEESEGKKKEIKFNL